MAQINKSSDYFNTVLYTGTGAENGITGVGFQPDFTWIKGRSTAYDHRLVDSVRGATKELYSDLTIAEATDTQGLKSFDSDGFTLGTTSAVNNSSSTFVSWNWLASNTTASNTDGSITSTVSANTTSGFSIVSYTGTGSNATVGHGLNSAPSMIIVKNRGVVGDWRCYHKSLGNTQLIRLNLTNATLTNTSWNNTTPTSTVFSIGVNDDVNQNSGNHIAYCFSDVKGFSKFGSYTGNGSTDGTFVYTGFKPSFLMIKRTDSTNNWLMYDNKRSAFNVTDDYLLADASDAEVTNNSGQALDLLSNGFKIKNSNLGSNASGGSYIYMAFASEPLVGSNNVPATAR